MNIGGPWLDLDEAELRVRVMQTKLHQWAITDPDRCFDDLYNLVYDAVKAANPQKEVHFCSTVTEAGEAAVRMARCCRLPGPARTQHKTPSGPSAWIPSCAASKVHHWQPDQRYEDDAAH